MKELRNKIMDYIMEVPSMNRDIIIAILNPLKTEQQAITFLNYLQENKDNKEVMRIDRLLKVRRKIAEEN